MLYILLPAIWIPLFFFLPYITSIQFLKTLFSMKYFFTGLDKIKIDNSSTSQSTVQSLISTIHTEQLVRNFKSSQHNLKNKMANTLELPEYVRELIYKIAKGEHFMEYSIYVARSNVGDGFIGILDRVCIAGKQNNKISTLQLICKTLPGIKYTASYRPRTV